MLYVQCPKLRVNSTTSSKKGAVTARVYAIFVTSEEGIWAEVEMSQAKACGRRSQLVEWTPDLSSGRMRVVVFDLTRLCRSQKITKSQQKMKKLNQKSKIKNQKAKNKKQRAKIKNQRAESKKQKSKIKKQK